MEPDIYQKLGEDPMQSDINNRSIKYEIGKGPVVLIGVKKILFTVPWG